MGLKRKDQNDGKRVSISFRVSEETALRLNVLGTYCGRGKTFALEELVDQEYERILKSDPSEVKKIKKNL